MWDRLSFKDRATLINQWRKQHVIDYAKKKREYNNAHKYDDGGNTNPMNYKYMGTIYDDKLKKEGVDIVTTPLKEVVVKGKAPDRPYFSSYDPLALYRYGIEPALEGAGKMMDLAMKPADYAIDAATSPAWWINKAITGNSDNTVQDIRNWTHTAMRDAPMVLSPTRDIGTLRTGFKYAPWNPENPGVFGNDEVGQALNNTMDLVTIPAMPKATLKGVESIASTPRVRAAVYNNITPLGYHITPTEVLGTVTDIIKPGKIDVSYPRWKQRYLSKIANGEISEQKGIDNYGIPTSAVVDFREQAWAKALRQPDSPLWEGKIYKDIGNGTYKYNMDVVNKIRTKHGGEKYHGEIFKNHKGDYLDAITSNGGSVNLTRYELENRIKNHNGLAVMTDTWDLQPLQRPINSFLNSKYGKILPESGKNLLRDIGNYEFVEQFFNGDPFKLDHRWLFDYHKNN